MIAMWVIPFGLSIKFFYIRFIIIWICFTIITTYVTRRATRQPIEPNTPRWIVNFGIFNSIKFNNYRLVYKWFLLVYKVSYGLAIAGYILIMMTFLGVNNLLLILPQVIEFIVPGTQTMISETRRQVFKYRKVLESVLERSVRSDRGYRMEMFGSGFTKKVPVRIQVQKVVSVQDSNLF